MRILQAGLPLVKGDGIPECAHMYTPEDAPNRPPPVEGEGVPKSVHMYTPEDAPNRPPPVEGDGVPNREDDAPKAGAEVVAGCWDPKAGVEPKEKGAGEEVGGCVVGRNRRICVCDEGACMVG